MAACCAATATAMTTTSASATTIEKPSSSAASTRRVAPLTRGGARVSVFFATAAASSARSRGGRHRARAGAGASLVVLASSDAVSTAMSSETMSADGAVALTRNGKKRVVVTGMGCVTAMGNDVDVFYEKLLNGESSITPITEWDAHEDMATTIAGEIKGFDPEEFMTKKMARRVDPFIAYQVRSIHWFTYDRVGVVNADP